MKPFGASAVGPAWRKGTSQQKPMRDSPAHADAPPELLLLRGSSVQVCMHLHGEQPGGMLAPRAASSRQQPLAMLRCRQTATLLTC